MKLDTNKTYMARGRYRLQDRDQYIWSKPFKHGDFDHVSGEFKTAEDHARQSLDFVGDSIDPPVLVAIELFEITTSEVFAIENP